MNFVYDVIKFIGDKDRILEARNRKSYDKERNVNFKVGETKKIGKVSCEGIPPDVAKYLINNYKSYVVKETVQLSPQEFFKQEFQKLYKSFDGILDTLEITKLMGSVIDNPETLTLNVPIIPIITSETVSCIGKAEVIKEVVIESVENMGAEIDALLSDEVVEKKRTGKKLKTSK